MVPFSPHHPVLDGKDRSTRAGAPSRAFVCQFCPPSSTLSAHAWVRRSLHHAAAWPREDKCEVQTQAAARLRPRAVRIMTEMPLPGCPLGERPTPRRSADERRSSSNMAWYSCASRLSAGMGIVLLVNRDSRPYSSPLHGRERFRRHLESSKGTSRRSIETEVEHRLGGDSVLRPWCPPTSASGSWLLARTHGAGHLHAVSVWQGFPPRCKPYAGQAAYACSDSQYLGNLDPHALRSDTPSDVPSDPSRAKRTKDPEVRPFFLSEIHTLSPTPLLAHPPTMTPQFQELLSSGRGLVTGVP